MRDLPYRFLPFLMFLMLSTSTISVAEPLQLDPSTGQYPLGLKVELLQDKKGDLTLQQVLSGDRAKQFVRSTQKVPNFAYTDATWWAKLTINSTSAEAQMWLLEIAFPQLDEITVYLVSPHDLQQAQQQTHSGDLQPFADRPLNHPNFVFELPTRPQQPMILIIRVHSQSALLLPMTIYTPKAFAHHSYQSALALGLYYGIMLVMVLYNLFIYINIRDQSYLYYVFNIIVFVLFMLSINGLAYQYLWPQSPWWANRSIQCLLAMGSGCALLFTRHFLRLKDQNVRLHRVFSWLLILVVFAMVSSLILTPATSMQSIMILVSIIYVVILYASINSMMSGYRPAKFFLLAWSWLLLGMGLRALLVKGQVDSYFLTEYAIQLGSALEVTLLSLALTDRFKLLARQVSEKDKLITDNAIESQRNAQKARLNAEKANQAKSTFIANVSHEIRTPLNAVLGHTQILARDKALNQRQKHSVEVIGTAGDHLLELINDILDISKIEANAMTLSTVDFELVDLVKGIGVMFESRCYDKKLQWQFINHGAASIGVHGDQGKLRQILINLLGNAVKFTEQGQVSLSLETSDNNHYRFAVSDSGPGINAEHQQEVFEAFGQTHEGAKHGGTGLGLAIASKHVVLMGGQLQLLSPPYPDKKQGSRFFFTLVLPPAHGPITPRKNRYYQTLKLMPGANVRAIVVDDIKANRDILVQILVNVGITVDTFDNSQQMMDELHRSEKLPDLVFIDVKMENQDGLSALQNIHWAFANTRPKCIVITTHAMKEAVEHLLKQGFDHYITKPFRFEAVYECIGQLLSNKFEYQNQPGAPIPEAQAAPTPKNKLDLTSITLPLALHQKIVEAATDYEVSRLETYLAELRNLGEQGKLLAEHFNQYLINYDMDELLDELSKVKHDS
ncbi:MAG: response regulator [Algicola sp.]|nr:response regulator [Algicola sp.]